MNNEEKTRITVDIFGNNYKLVGSFSPSYMKSVAAYVNDQMNTISKGFPSLDYPRIAVLAAVQMADELLKLREQWDKVQKTQQHDQKTAENYHKLEEKQSLIDVELRKEREANHKLQSELQQVMAAYEEASVQQEEKNRATQS